MLKITLLTTAIVVSSTLFANPANEMNPVIPFLAITGKPSDRDIERKVEALKVDGFDQFLVYARSGLEYRYMGEEWLKTVEACCREGAKRGMKVWLYDEYNWPSGTCKGRVPAADQRFRYSEWAIYPEKDGSFRWEIVYAPAGWVNVYESEAIKLFIQMTHEVYERRLGKYFDAKVIPGIFTDEPGHHASVVVGKDCRLHIRRWIGMEDEYRAATGRDFRADVEAFIVKRGDASVWTNYFRLMGKRFRSSYFDQIRAWCDKMGIALTGHMIGEGWLPSCMQANGDPLHVLKGETIPGIDEISSVVRWNGGWCEWITFATAQHAIDRIGNGGLVELYACGPNDMNGAWLRQMIWMCALHGIDHYLTSMQIMDHRGLVEKHGYLSPIQLGQPWHGELKPFFDDAKLAAVRARRRDVVRHAAVRQPFAASAASAFRAGGTPKLYDVIRAFDGGQLSVDLIAEDEQTDLPYVFEMFGDGSVRESRTGAKFIGESAASKAADWLRERTKATAARFYEQDGKLALGLVVREWRDGSIAAIDIMNHGTRQLRLDRNGRSEAVTLPFRGVFVLEPNSSNRDLWQGCPRPGIGKQYPIENISYSLDRANVFRIPFSTNRVAKFTIKSPLKGLRLALRTYAKSYAVTASGRPVDDGEGEPPDEKVFRHLAEPYSFELDGRPIAAENSCLALPDEFRPLYAETGALELAPGSHTIRLVTGEDDVNFFLPAAFVVGNFAVAGDELGPLPPTLAPGAIASQGLAGYCGKITYRIDDVAMPDGLNKLRLNVGNAFARVRWNGVDLGSRGWAPYEWRLNEVPVSKSNGRLEVTVFTSVYNIFGDHERLGSNWDMKFWNPQHDADSVPGLYSVEVITEASPVKSNTPH